MIEIPFLEEFRADLLEGRKVATTRTKPYVQEGEPFSAFGATFLEDRTLRTNLLTVATIYYREEARDDPEHFIETWNRLHPRRGYQPTDTVYLHLFHRTG